MIMTGVAHVHSTYSYDGCHPLRDIVAYLRQQALDFVLKHAARRLDRWLERQGVQAPPPVYRLARRLFR